MINKSLLLSSSEAYWILSVRQIQVTSRDPFCSIVFTPLDSHVIVKAYRIVEFNVTYRILVPMNLRCEISRNTTVDFFDIVQQENIQTAPRFLYRKNRSTSRRSHQRSISGVSEFKYTFWRKRELASNAAFFQEAA